MDSEVSDPIRSGHTIAAAECIVIAADCIIATADCIVIAADCIVIAVARQESELLLRIQFTAT
jgi:hypothetical protein